MGDLHNMLGDFHNVESLSQNLNLLLAVYVNRCPLESPGKSLKVFKKSIEDNQNEKKFTWK